MVYASLITVRVRKKNGKVYEYQYWYLRHRVKNTRVNGRWAEWRMYLGKDLSEKQISQCIREVEKAKPWIKEIDADDEKPEEKIVG